MFSSLKNPKQYEQKSETLIETYIKTIWKYNSDNVSFEV